MQDDADESARAITPVPARILEPLDRISEILFGLIMAVTIVGSLSIATAGRDDLRTVLVGALGCNLAWGLVDAVMYLVRAASERSRLRRLAARVLSAPAGEAAHASIRAVLPEHVARITGPAELDGMRRRLADLPAARGPLLGVGDYLAAGSVFVLVVLATFPVVLPFLLVDELARAMNLSRAITVALLFVAGVALGRYAGHPRPFLTGSATAVLGVALILLVMALGG
jgi:hypothetical protein